VLEIVYLKNISCNRNLKKASEKNMSNFFQNIGLDIRCTTCIGGNLSFPGSFLRKIQKTSKNPSKLAHLMVTRYPEISQSPSFILEIALKKCFCENLCEN